MVSFEKALGTAINWLVIFTWNLAVSVSHHCQRSWVQVPQEARGKVSSDLEIVGEFHRVL